MLTVPESSPTLPALFCPAAAAGTVADRRRALRLLFKPMSCCGILGKRSKRSTTPDGCEVQSTTQPSPSLRGDRGASACSVGAAAAASTRSTTVSCAPAASAVGAAAAAATNDARPLQPEPAAAVHQPWRDSLLRAQVLPQQLTSVQPTSTTTACAASASGPPASAAAGQQQAMPPSAGVLSPPHDAQSLRSATSSVPKSTEAQPAAVARHLVTSCDGALQLIAAEELAALLASRSDSASSCGTGSGNAARWPVAHSSLPALLPGPVSLLDCRAFMAYNHGHIAGAINVSCTNKCAQKRMRHGRVGDFITASEAREAFRTSSQVVVYDDATADLGSMTDTLGVLVTALLKENKNIRVLKGGMKGFREKYHTFCASSVLPPVILPSGAEPKEQISGQFAVSRSSPHAASRSEALDETQTVFQANGGGGGSSLMECPPSAILPFLYIGNESDASNLDSLQQLGITHVLNATTHAPCTYEHSDFALKYKRLPVKDTMQQNMQAYFKEAIDFIEDARQGGGRVLVHCHAGVSRSATLAIAYLLSRTRLTTLEAYEFVKQRRCVVAPNISFMGQLLEYERALGADSQGRLNELPSLLDGLGGSGGYKTSHAPLLLPPPPPLPLQPPLPVAAVSADSAAAVAAAVVP